MNCNLFFEGGGGMSIFKKNRVFKFLIFLPFILLIILSGCPNGNGEEDTPHYWVAVGNNGEVRISEDRGITWQPGSSGTSNNFWCITTDGNGLWMASIQFSSNNKPSSEIFFSTDHGNNWTTVGMQIQGHYFRDIEVDNYGLVFVAVGCFDEDGPDIMYSQNGGAAWHQVSGLGTRQDCLFGVDTDDMGHWVTVGSHSKILWSSQPTSQWQIATIYNTIGVAGIFRDVTYAGSRIVDNTNQDVWILVGQNTGTTSFVIYRSFDHGHTWNQNTPSYQIPLSTFYAIASDDNGTCVAGGEPYLLYLTRDYGDNWEIVWLDLMGIYENITDITYDGNGRWIATLHNGEIMWADHSTLAFAWQKIGTGSTAVLNGISYGE